MMLRNLLRFDWADIPASGVVFIVAMPLSLGVAIASGASPEAGLVAAMTGGILVGLFAGSPLMVSGPAAGMTVLVYQAVQQHGLLGLAVATVFCGLIQISLGIFRAGDLFKLIPKYVLHGMLAAIGSIIFLGQLHVLMGGIMPKNPLAGIGLLGHSLQTGFSHDTFWITPLFACGLLAVILQIAWPKMFPRLAWLPGALPAVAIATLLSLPWDMERLAISPLLPVMRQGADNFLSLSWLDSWAPYLAAGFGMALVASAESLLTARATDILAAQALGQDAPVSNLDRELIAQGVGNAFSGLAGGLPITGVIVRSSANISAGAKTRWSAILHGVWILLLVSFAPVLLNAIPLTALAAVLVVTGCKLFNMSGLVAAFKESKVHGGIWVATMAAIVATNLLTGLLIALGLAALANGRAIKSAMIERLAPARGRA